MTATLGLERYSDRCDHGYALVQHPQFCNCDDLAPWAIFVSALEKARRESSDGLVHQHHVRPHIRDHIAPKRIGQLYARAKREGVLRQVGKEPSTDERGRNTHHDSPIYRLRSAA